MGVLKSFNFVSEQSKALIRLGTGCNNNCVFCHGRTGGEPYVLETEEVKNKISLADKAGVGMVVFSGGEPTMRKDLPELMAEVMAYGMDSGLITNGRMFYYKKFVDQIMDAGLKYALISLHGSKAEIHNRMTGAISFDQTIKGLKNISERGINLVVNTVLTRHNAADLGKIHSLLRIFEPVHHKISLPEPKGSALDNFRIIMSPENAAGAVAALLQEIETTEKVTIGFDGFTPCLLNGYFTLKDDFFTHGFYLVSEPWEKEFFRPTHGKRDYYTDCAYCSLRHLCPGVYKEYIDGFPSFRPEPLTRPISNNIRFSLIDTDTLPGEDDHQRIDGLKKTDPLRWIAVRNKERMQYYRTDEAQTDNTELSRVKYECEQVYLNTGSPECGACFPKHLKKLSLTQKCRDCENKYVCPGIYEEAQGDVFVELRKTIDNALEVISGRVLEIGYGKGPYFKKILDGMKEGRISGYVGIDPELHALEKPNERDDMLFVKTSLEDFQWNGEQFDTIVLLRSYHHLRDLKYCVEKISSMLREGGRLVISEDYKHAELKDDSQDQLEQNAGSFEHFRNHDSGEAIIVFSRHGFTVEKENAVTSETTATWMVSLIKK